MAAYRRGDGEMKTEILKIKGDWEEVVNDCRHTVGKEDLSKEPSEAFKRSILISEHSPIRALIVRWKWASIKSWIATHWSRHKWECFIRTQRADRTGKDRDELPQSTLVAFRGEANAQQMIDTWRKRLCHMASKETREYAEDFKKALWQYEPEVANVLVPNCVYRGGCPEIQTCGEWAKFIRFSAKHGVDVCRCSIENRYVMYNRYFNEQIKGGTNEPAEA